MCLYTLTQITHSAAIAIMLLPHHWLLLPVLPPPLLLLALLQVKEMYNWPNVAQRTVAVYDRLAALPTIPPRQELLSRLRRYRSIGAWAGLVFCCIVMWLHWFWCLLEWQQPAAGVNMAADWPSIQDMMQGGDDDSGGGAGKAGGEGGRGRGEARQARRAFRA